MGLALSATQRRLQQQVLAKVAQGHYELEAVPECICGSGDAQPLAAQDRYGIPVGAVLCVSCGLVRSTPRLAERHLPQFYELEYHGLHQGVAQPDPETALFRRGQGAAIYRFLAPHLPSHPLRVADIGAGTGQVLREFEAAAGRVVTSAGCEYASAYVEAGRAAGSDIRPFGPDALMDAAPFDVVILSHVVEHFTDSVTDLMVIHQLGHADTLYYVEVPGLLTIADKPEYAYSYTQFRTVAHMFDFTLATLTATMRRAGFALVAGDEQVRSIFRWGPVSEPGPDPREATKVLDSLRSLDAPPNRLRRLRPLARQHVAAVAKSLLPERAVRAIRSRR